MYLQTIFTLVNDERNNQVCLALRFQCKLKYFNYFKTKAKSSTHNTLRVQRSKNLKRTSVFTQSENYQVRNISTVANRLITP